MILLIFTLVSNAVSDSEEFRSKTPYRLILPIFGPVIHFTEADLVKIGENFDLCYGHLPSMDELDRIRSVNPGFLALRYYGTWTSAGVLEYPLQCLESEYRDAFLHYRVAVLDQDIDSLQDRFRIREVTGAITTGTAHPDSSFSYTEDGITRYHTCLRVDEEYMKITGWEGDTVTVERGFFGTCTAPHREGASVLSPLYNTDPNSDRQAFAYQLDPAHPLRWKYLAGACIMDMEHHGANGIYIDILGSNTLRATRMDGVVTLDYWDRTLDSDYTFENFRKASEKGVDLIQDSVYAVTGRYPVIFGNNMTAYTYRDGKHDRYKFLTSTPEKPRPIDGYMIEDCWGGYTIDQWIEFDTEGRKVIPVKASPGTDNYRNWAMNLRELVDCGQNGWGAAPQMINGGMKNYAFEFLSMEEQHGWFLWAYASYLMGVHVEEDGTTSTWQGITARITGDPYRRISIDPVLQWKIGDPVLTLGPEELDGYKITGRTYLRPFTNGVVLVNPYLDDDPVTVDLTDYGGPYINPDSGELIREIRMKAGSGRILLRDYDPEDYPGYPDPASGPYRGTPYLEIPFTVPTGYPVPMRWFDMGSAGVAMFDPDLQPSWAYMTDARRDSLDTYPHVELTGDPPGIFRVTHGEYWRYTVDVTQEGSYSAALHYGGTSQAPTVRTFRLSVYRPDSMKPVFSDTVVFDFGPGIGITPLDIGGILLQKGIHVVEWKALYTGARPNLDHFTITRNLSRGKAPGWQAIRIYPTPCNGEFFICGADGGRAELFDLSGNRIRTVNLWNEVHTMHIQDLAPGIYIVRVSSDGVTKRSLIIHTN